MNCCVYALIDPRDGIEFYIGIGRITRPRIHFMDADNNSKQNYRLRKIRKLRQLGIADKDMVLYLKRDIPRDEALDLEMALVKLLGRHSTGEGPLTNLTPGGDSNPHDDPAVHRKQLRSIQKRFSDPIKVAQQSQILKRLFADPAFAAAHAKRCSIKAYKQWAQTDSKIAIGVRNRWNDPEHKAEMSEKSSKRMYRLHELAGKGNRVNGIRLTGGQS